MDESDFFIKNAFSFASIFSGIERKCVREKKYLLFFHLLILTVILKCMCIHSVNQRNGKKPKPGNIKNRIHAELFCELNYIVNILIAEQTHFYNEILTDFNWHDKGPIATHQRVQAPGS